MVHKFSCQQLRFLYLRGKDVSFDMTKYFDEAEICLDEAVCYDAQKAAGFSDAFLSHLKADEIGAISFFSKRSAEAFLGHAKNSQVLECLNRINALCISESVLEYLYSYFQERALYATTADMQGMMALVARFKVV